MYNATVQIALTCNLSIISMHLLITDYNHCG